MISRPLAFATLALALAAPSAQLAAAEDAARVMIVLDASGSMWGRLGEKTRIEVAREVIRDLMADWDPAVEVGLSAYGHRRKDDCTDIETLVPVGSPQPQAIVAAVDALQPKGMTPLSEAVRRAAQELGYTARRATVVLVSDGVETCKADPCQVGAELARSGVGFTAHVIGFGVTGAEQTGLRCLAKNTGGLFLAASDATSLREALATTVEKAKEAPRPAVEKPGPASLGAPASVVAGARFEVRWQGPDARKDYVTVVPAGAPDHDFLDYAYTADGTPLALTAPDVPGSYEVRYVFDSTRTVLARAPLRVDAAVASVAGPAAVPAGGRIEVRWTGPANPRDYLTIAEASAPDGTYLGWAYAKDGNPAAFQAPDQPGAYELRYVTGESNRTLARAAITVVATSATLSGPATATAGQALSIAWEGPNNDRDYVTIVAAGAQEGSYLDYAYTRNGSPAKFQAPESPGAHELRYVTGGGRTLARRPITILAATASLSAPSTVGAGQSFAVRFEGPNGQGDYVTIVASGAAEGSYLDYAYTRDGSPATIDAPKDPGAYEVRYVTGGGKTLARAPITVR